MAQTTGSAIAVILTAILLALFHQPVGLAHWISFIASGAAYGWIGVASRSTTAGALMHAIYNLALFLSTVVQIERNQSPQSPQGWHSRVRGVVFLVENVRQEFSCANSCCSKCNSAQQPRHCTTSNGGITILVNGVDHFLAIDTPAVQSVFGPTKLPHIKSRVRDAAASDFPVA